MANMVGLVSVLLALNLIGPTHHNNFIKSAVAQSNHNNNIILSSNGPQYQQHNNILHFFVHENSPNNTYLGNIRSSDGQPPFMVLPAPQTPESERMQALSVNLLNGDLTTNSVLDREHREQYHFVAIVKEPFAEIKCTVTVKDVNDNAPVFLLPPSNETNYVIEVPEGQRGVRRVLPLAVDIDTPQYGIKEFRIVSGNTPTGAFQLVEHEAPARSALQSNSLLAQPEDTSGSMMIGPSDNPQLIQQLAQQATVLIPSQPIMQSPTSTTSITSSSSSTSQSKYLIDLEVNQTLDRENQSSYQLVIEAIDGGQPQLVGLLMVTVNVQDVNDNDPVFSKKVYETHLKEDSAKGSFLRVQAHDVDLDTNGQISYFIKRHSSSSQPTINSNLNSSDNIEATGGGSRASYTASSSNSNNNNNKQQRQQQPSTTTPLSNNKLDKQQRQQGSNNEAVIYNSEQANSAEANSKTKISSTYNGGAQQEQMFEIDPVKGDIYLVHQLDYETDQMHELLIEARDHGKPSRSAYAYVKVIVDDVPDDTPPASATSINGRQSLDNDKKLLSSGSSESTSSGSRSASELKFAGLSGDLSDVVGSPSNWFQNGSNLLSWFSQINSSLLFVIVLVALFAVAFSVCFVKIKSRQPESDYNDTAGLTLTSNNGQTKQSPSHSTSNEHSNGSNDNHHRHHDHQWRANGSFGGLNGSSNGFGGGANGKLRYQSYTDSSNLYHNLYPQQQPRHTSNHLQQSDSPSNHQMASGGGGGNGGSGGSAGGTMTLHNHHHTLLGSPGGHHSLEHHQFSPVGPVSAAHHSSSLTYAHHHSRAALLHQAHHHQSSHHLSSVHHGGGGHHHNSNNNNTGSNNDNLNNKGGTMNSVGTHHSIAHPSASPLPATPNTTHSSGLPPNLHDAHHHHGGVHNPLLPLPPQPSQLPPTPCNAPVSVFSSWPQAPGSTMGTCFPGGPSTGGPLGHLSGSGSAMAVCAPSSQPLDRWFDLGVSSQLVYAHDWYGSYNWDYLTDWTPDYHTLMPLIQADACGY